MRLVRVAGEEKYIRAFIKLPAMLYAPSENMEDKQTMRALLMGTHLLSKYFTLESFLVYDDKEQPAGRFCITIYPEDDTAYLGFFECVNRKEVAKFLFDSAYDFCKKNGYAKIMGPVDASFWIKYRLKINRFEGPYTGEPYNQPYYFDLFQENGFQVAAHYVSNTYRRLDKQYTNKRHADRYHTFTEKGYEIRSPKPEEFTAAMDEVYQLVTTLYKDFPIFKPIEKEDFRRLFKSYQTIMNMSMTKLAYDKGKAVGFYVSIPDYGNLVYHTESPVNLCRILWRKKRPKRYVMLYMGVEKEHRGLGSALVYAIMKELMESGLPSIGALMMDHKVTRAYAKDVINGTYEYVLLEKEIRKQEAE